MTPEAALVALLAAQPQAVRIRPTSEAAREVPSAQVFYGAELPAPFLPVLPPAASWDLPEDLKDALGAPVPGGAGPAGWLALTASLVLRAPRGALVHELGVGRFSEGDGSLTRDMRADASRDGRFAWHFQKVARRGPGAVERAQTTDSTLVYLGSRGQILLRLDGADAPDGLPPAVLSDSGEVLLAARREAGAWTAAAYSFTGKELATVAGAHRLAGLAVSGDGRRALVAWAGLDEPLIVTLFDLARDERRDIPAERLPPGPWGLAADGTLTAGGRPVPSLP